MVKTISVSARVSEEVFEAFKQEYLNQLETSFNEDTPKEFIDNALDVSNSEVVSMAMRFGLKFLKQGEMEK